MRNRIGSGSGSAKVRSVETSWDDWKLFLAVAETGSLSAAARKLAVGQPTVSRRLALLEEAYGEALVERKSDGVELTQAGIRLVEPAKKMAELAAELERLREEASDAMRGVVKITAAPGVAYDFVVPFAAEFQKSHPSIQLQVLAQVDYLDLGRREADIALRMKKADSKELVTLASVSAPVALYASSTYAERLSPDATIRDLDFILWAPPFEGRTPRPELERMLGPIDASFSSDDYLIQRRAADLGLGAFFGVMVTHRYFDGVKLVRLPQFEPSEHFRGEVHLVVSKSALSIPKVRLVAESLAEELKQTVALRATD